MTWAAHYSSPTPTTNGLPYKWLPISCRSGAGPEKVRRSETDVLPLSYTTELFKGSKFSCCITGGNLLAACAALVQPLTA